MIIDILLNEYEDIFHHYSKSTINPELANYIYDECIGNKKKTDITIEISCNNLLTEEEKKNIEFMIKNHFANSIKEEKLKDKHQYLVYLLLFILGILMITLDILIKSTIFSEVFNIIAWVIIWEIFYDVIFTQAKDSIKIARYKRIVKAHIKFI